MDLGHCTLHGVARDRMYGVVGCSVCEFNSALGLEPPRKTIRLAPNAPSSPTRDEINQMVRTTTAT